MGAYFTNVQIRAGASGSEGTRAAIIETVRRRMATAGLVAAADHEPASRTVSIGPAERWIVVYDSLTGHDLQRVDALAAEISRGVDGAAVAVAVQDSDVLTMTLFRRGDEIGRFDSNPDEYAMAPSPRRPSGDTEPWRDQLRDGATIDDLHAAWDAPYVLAEDRLRRIGDLFGWDPIAAATGVGYLDSVAPPGLERFRFKRAPRAAGTPPRSMLTIAIGDRTLIGVVGKQFMLSVAAYNEGDRSAGLSIRLSGGAIDARLVAVDRLMVYWAGDSGDGPEAEITPDGDDSWFADVVLEADQPGRVVVLLFGVAMLVGSAPLQVTLAHASTTDLGDATFTTTVQIVA